MPEKDPVSRHARKRPDTNPARPIEVNDIVDWGRRSWARVLYFEKGKACVELPTGLKVLGNDPKQLRRASQG